MTALLSSFTIIKKKEVLFDQRQKELIKREYFSSRMEDIFFSLCSSDQTVCLEQISPHEISFTFDNKVDPDPCFSGEIDGKLSLIDSHLILSLYPKESSYRVKEEDLLASVNDFELFTLNPSSYQWEKLTSHPTLPLSIKMIVHRKQKEEFAFLLPSSHQQIIIAS